MLQVGMTYTVEQTVTTDMTARAIGSGGLEVFGTPFMMAMMESAAMLCVQPELPDGKGTVGVDIDLELRRAHPGRHEGARHGGGRDASLKTAS
ncbi:MAG: hypothetical protein V8S81_04270 [Oscillospiraceae bacterium]